MQTNKDSFAFASTSLRLLAFGFIIFFSCPMNGMQGPPHEGGAQELIEAVKKIFTQQRDIDLNAIDQQIDVAQKTSGQPQNFFINMLAAQVYVSIFRDRISAWLSIQQEYAEVNGFQQNQIQLDEDATKQGTRNANSIIIETIRQLGDQFQLQTFPMLCSVLENLHKLAAGYPAKMFHRQDLAKLLQQKPQIKKSRISCCCMFFVVIAGAMVPIAYQIYNNF